MAGGKFVGPAGPRNRRGHAYVRFESNSNNDSRVEVGNQKVTLGRDTLNDSVIRDFIDIRWMEKIMHDLVYKQHTAVFHRSPADPYSQCC